MNNAEQTLNINTSSSESHSLVLWTKLCKTIQQRTQENRQFTEGSWTKCSHQDTDPDRNKKKLKSKKMGSNEAVGLKTSSPVFSIFTLTASFLSYLELVIFLHQWPDKFLY